MNCRSTRESLGAYLDGELPVEACAALEAHLAGCSTCAVELDSLRALARSLEQPPTKGVPAELWDRIERGLQSSTPIAASSRRGAVFSRRFALAASVLIAVGLGGWAIWSFNGGASVANAATVDFSVLLDALPHDAVGAFEKFLSKYQARLVSPAEARNAAKQLDFEIPDVLPGGFRLEKAYTMRFGDEAGAAASYSRYGEFLGAIFHRPVHREEFGSHKDYDCVIGKHRGHAVAVGDWKLVHVTDATTCHCVLSKLNEQSKLSAVLSAVAPRSSESSPPNGHSDLHESSNHGG